MSALPLSQKPWMDSALPLAERVELLLGAMTLAEKVGQTTQTANATPDHAEGLRAGRYGSSLYASGAWAGNIADEGTHAGELNAVQRIAVEESRLGIPLLFGRDVIHGLRTVAPLPLAQAASWNPQRVRDAARDAAREASALGLRWTFTPMLDIARDPRWGRIVEGFGEDPYLCAAFARAAVQGYQGDDLSHPESIAACAKHFCAYGAAEGGRDYNTVSIGPRSLRDTYLPPFRAAIEAGCATVMASFNDIDGIPSTANRHLLTDILRGEWGFDGFVVSDWNAVLELVQHGVAEDAADAAALSITAGLDMCMRCGSYDAHLADLVARGRVPLDALDDAVRNILRVKFRLGLFERPYTDAQRADTVILHPDHRARAHALAREAMVLLKNDGILPLSEGNGSKLLVCGPLVDARREMLGTWTLDGRAEDVTSFADAFPEYRTDPSTYHIARLTDEAVLQARHAGAAIVCLGESHTRTGEAMSTVSIELPPGQQAFLEALHRFRIPIIAVVFAGRPLDLSWLEEHAAAILFAWHPGTEGPRAALDLLFGRATPSGRLPVSFPRHGGQIPLYYNRRNTSRPIPPATLDASPVGVTRYNDELDTPLFPFGFGLSYTTFAYENLQIDEADLSLDGTLRVRATVRNTGDRAGREVVQLYVRDRVGSVTRPIRELKGFAAVELEPGETRVVAFEVPVGDLAFTTASMEWKVEPGTFDVWVAPDATRGLHGTFRVLGS